MYETNRKWQKNIIFAMIVRELRLSIGWNDRDRFLIYKVLYE